MQPATYAAGVRRTYQSLPRAVHAWVEDQLGGPVTQVRNTSGGFSPGVAAVVSSGSAQLFVKAVGSGVNEEALLLYVQESRVSARLPVLDGVLAPLAAAELEADGERYAVITFPALDGSTPQHPWRATDLQACLAALHRLSQQLTPSPWRSDADAASPRLPSFLCGWRAIADDPTDSWQADPWVGPRLGDLVAAESELLPQLAGDTLSHIDLRADNLVLTPDRVWFVDWAHAENAAAWVDVAVLLSDVVASRADRGDGGEVDVVDVIRSHPQLGRLPYPTVWALQVAMAGALHAMSRRPSPPGLPTIRSWQALTARTILDWCRRESPSDW